LLVVVGAFLTAFYMTRQICYVFFGTSRSPMRESGASADHRGLANISPPAHKQSHPIHESPPVMIIPLAVLAVCTMLFSIVGTPAWPWLESYLGGHPTTFDLGRLLESSTLKTMLLSILTVALGIGTAGWLYGRPASTADDLEPLARLQPSLFNILANKFYIDELYHASVIRFTDALATVAHWLDRFVWGGIVKLISLFTLGLSWLNRFIDDYVVNLGFDESCESVRRTSGLVARLQSGQIQKYLRWIGIALSVLFLILMWGCGQ
jgi:NADH-quinone oxidoreductase subunit L